MSKALVLDELKSKSDLLTRELMETDLEQFQSIFSEVRDYIASVNHDSLSLEAHGAYLIALYEQLDDLIASASKSKENTKQQLIKLKHSSQSAKKYQAL